MSLRHSGMRAGLDSPTRRFPAGYLELPQLGGPVPWPPEPYLPPRNTWLQRRTPDADPRLYGQWEDLAFGSGKFVAVGGNAVMWTTDGIDWNPVDLPYPLSAAVWTSVAYGGGLWVALARWTGNEDIPQIMTASDPGGTWTERTAPINRQWTGLAWGGGLWVACADGEDFTGDGNGCMSMNSTTGTSWTVPWLFDEDTPTLHYGLRGNPTVGQAHQWTSVAYGWDPVVDGNIWVAVTRDPTEYKRQAMCGAYCTDPTTAGWTLITGPQAGADKVIWTGTPDGEPEYDEDPLVEFPMASRFVSVRLGPSEIYDPAYHSGFKTIKNIRRSDGVFGIEQGWGESPQVPAATKGWRSIARGPGGPNGSGTLVTMTDYGSDNGADAARGVIRCVDAGRDGTDPYPHGSPLGSGGFHWYTAFAWEGQGYPLVAYGNDRFVGLNDFDTQQQTSFVSLDDGQTWSSNVIAGSTDWCTIAFGGPYYGPKNDQRVWVMLSARNAADAAAWSVNAEEPWTRVEIPGSDENDISWRKVRWFDHISKFVAIGTLSRGLDALGSAIMTSSTGKTWPTPQSMWSLSGAGPRFKDIAYGEGQFVAVGDGGVARIAYSSSLTSWTRPEGDFDLTQFALLKAVCFGGPAGFVAVGQLNQIATSPDGVNDWAFVEVDFHKPDLTPIIISFEDVIWVELDPADGDSYYSAIGHADTGTTHLARSLDGVTWEHLEMGSGAKTWAAHVYSPKTTWAVARTNPSISGAYIIGAERDNPFELQSTRQQPQPPLAKMDYADIGYGRGRYAACARGTVFGGFNQQVATCDPNYVRPALQYETVDIVGADVWRDDVVGAAETEAGLVAALSDTSDSTYLEWAWNDPGEFGDVLASLEGVEFAELANPDDLDIEGFWVLARMSRTPAESSAVWQVNVEGLEGARFEGGSFNLGVNTTPTDYFYLTYTRVGAKYWTPEEFAQARFTVFLTGIPPATFRLYRLRLQAIYAAPHVETVPVGEVLAKTGTVVGHPNSTAGMVLAMNDGYDTTYLEGTGTPTGTASATVGFAALLNPTSRPIKSFVIEVRAVVWAGTGGSLTVDTFTGLTPDPLGHSGPIPLTDGVTVTYKAGPFVKDGGGVWTESQINALTCVIEATATGGTPAAVRVAAASLTVTYARGD